MRALAPWLFGLVLLLAVGCEVFTAPERHYDPDVARPLVSTLDLGEVEPGQHVAGVVRLNLDLDSLIRRIERVEIRVGERSVMLEQPPYEYELDTRDWPEGAHEIAVGIYERAPRHGLLVAAGIPYLLLRTTLVFDQRPPTPPPAPELAWRDTRLQVTWQPTLDPNFYAYLVLSTRRLDDSHRGYVPGFDGGYAVDTLYDRHAVSYLSPPVQAGYGSVHSYRIAVWNRSAIAGGAAASSTYGTQVALPGIRWGVRWRPLPSPTRPELYAFTHDALVALSTATHTVVRSVDPAQWHEKAVPLGLMLSTDGTRLYTRVSVSIPHPSLPGRSTTTHRILVLDAATFAVQAQYEVPQTLPTVAAGADDRLYAIDGRTLRLLDGDTGAERARLADLPPSSRIAAFAPDGQALYISNSLTLMRVDLASDTLRRGASYVLDYDNNATRAVGVAPDGRLYYHARADAVEVLDGTTLALRETIPLTVSSPSGDVQDISVDGTGLYLNVAWRSGSVYDPAGAVLRYHLDGGAPLATWHFHVVPQSFAIGGEHLYAFIFDGQDMQTWFVPVQSSVDEP